MINVDVRGFSCPIPVVRTKKAIEQSPGQMITVLVDNEVAKENVSRLAKSMGYNLTVEKKGDGYCLTIAKK